MANGIEDLMNINEVLREYFEEKVADSNIRTKNVMPKIFSEIQVRAEIFRR